ncbi:MAG: LysM peptidoglycan-binding domain-containing protein [Rubricoccaceae bacterium]|nr:LysM peptidoglycan-binding domain-containing protein [Rubricoccaceae bacterium]
MRLLLLLAALPALFAPPVQAQRPLADKIEDLRRTAAVRAALAEDGQTRAYDVIVTTEDGVVALSGEVGTLGARERAEAVARAVRGVRAVENGLRVEGQPAVLPTRAEAPPAERVDAPPARAAAEPPAEEPEAQAPQPTYHTVGRGDTLYSIARRYGTTVEALQRLNRLRSTDIRVGQRLRVR